MVTDLNGLISIDQGTHLTTSPIHRTTGSNFTHMFHSRHFSKEDLAVYSSHPSHESVVKEPVLSICEDIMAVDCIGDLPPKGTLAGSMVRVTFLKLKENLGKESKNQVLEIVRGVKDSFGGNISEFSFGDNFAPARANGFSIAALTVFPGMSEMEAVDANEAVVNFHKEKVKDYLEDVIVVDISSPLPNL